MEITEEALKSSLNELQDLEKSHKATGIGEPLKKSAETPAAADVGNSDKETDLYKAHYMKKMMDESDHDYDERMKKMGPYDDMKKMVGENDHDYDERMKKMGPYDHMNKNYEHPGMPPEHVQPSTGYHGEMKQMEGESDHSYEIRKKNMAAAGHSHMEKMNYSHASEESDLLKSFQEDGQLKKAIDVSDFLKSLVEKTTLHLSAVDGRLEKSFSHLLEIFDSQNEVITNLAEKYEGLQKSFNDVLAQPVGAPRSVGNGILPIGRGPGDLNKSQINNPVLLRKSILNKMSLAFEKGEIRDTEIIKFESTGEISNENLARFGSQG